MGTALGDSTGYMRWYWHGEVEHAATWLRHYDTSRKVAGSIPDKVTGFFQLT
jgi:hypothetical protein